MTSDAREGSREPAVDDLARVLMAAWERAEGKPVNVSYVATFADMARAAIREWLPTVLTRTPDCLPFCTGGMHEAGCAALIAEGSNA